MDEAAARRERLKALKAAQQLVEGDAAAAGAAQAAGEPAAEPEKPVLKFRNYTVKDEQHIQLEKVRQQHPQVHTSTTTGLTACIAA
jgi:coiled-coil domain-containing protein 12